MISAYSQGSAGLRQGPARALPLTLNRHVLFAGLVVVGFLNGIAVRLVRDFREDSFTELVMNTFEISAIVWIALAVSVCFLHRSPQAPLTRADGIAATAATATFLIPIPPLSWIGLSALAAYVLHTSPRGSLAHRGGWILLALTVPMFWSRAAFVLLNDPILEIDALLVALIVGTERAGNTIGFSDGSGYLWIAPGCSSLTNVSLAILCWVLFTQLFYRDRPLRRAWWCVLACAAVVALNVARLSLIAAYPQYHDALHGPLGATLANWLTFAAIIGVCFLGVRGRYR